MAVFIQNKKVRLNYEILKTLEAGIELFGHEVKALRNKQGSLKGAHVIARGDEVFLVGATIPPYQAANTPDSYDAMRPRKLLLTKREIGEIAGSESQKGLTIVPISVYSKARKLKLEIAIVRGKKQHDKREDLKKKDAKRSIAREMKREVR